MSGRQFPSADTAIDHFFLGSLYLSQLCALLVVIALYRLAYKTDVLEFLFSRPGILCLAGTLGLVASSVVIVHKFRQSRHSGSRQLIQTLVMNLLVILFLVAVGEGTLRLISVQTKLGVVLGD